ncbi:MAG: hypothetical protein IJS15_07225, partial [Victivallales bacterium]|nr:hypothetical protein [Victivallales bacterium]
ELLFHLFYSLFVQIERLSKKNHCHVQQRIHRFHNWTMDILQNKREENKTILKKLTKKRRVGDANQNDIPT